MEEILLSDGDQVPDGAGDFRRVQGSQAMLQRVLFRLCARRGSFPFLPGLGSGLYRLRRERAEECRALCGQYVRQALEEEDVKVTDVLWEDSGGQARVTVSLLWQGETWNVTAQLGGWDENR